MDHSSLSVSSWIPLELYLLFPPENSWNAKIPITFIPWYKIEGLLLSQPACFVLQLAFLIYDFVCAFAYETRTETQRYCYFLLQIGLMVTNFYFIMWVLNCYVYLSYRDSQWILDECDNNIFLFLLSLCFLTVHCKNNLVPLWYFCPRHCWNCVKVVWQPLIISFPFSLISEKHLLWSCNLIPVLTWSVLVGTTFMHPCLKCWSWGV